MTRTQAVAITVDEESCVSGLLQVPHKARVCYVLAHGAGAGMLHPFMAVIADGLAERGIATLRYQFPYMEQGRKRPDTSKLAQPQCARPSVKRCVCFQSLPLSPAASRLAVA